MSFLDKEGGITQHINNNNVHVITNGQLTSDISKQIIKDKEPEDPLFVCNCDELINLYNLWNKLLPNVKPYYAVKCNSDKMVLKILATLGCNFDCASAGEIKTILDLGIESDRIIYANPTKQISHLKFAANNGIIETVFDNEAELYKIKAFHPKAKLLLRVCVPLNSINQIENEVNRYHLKFGTTFLEAIELLKKCKELDLNIIGLCFHSGYETKGILAYAEAIKICLKLFIYAKEKLGLNLNVLDIGGGQTFNTIHEIAHIVKSTLASAENDRSSELLSNLDIRAQPGKYFVHSTFTLITQIHSMRVKEIHAKPSFKYYINAGKYNGLLDFVVWPDSFKILPIPIIQEQAAISKDLFETEIWGPTMDPSDLVSSGIQLPLLSIGDWIYFENVGAYTLTQCTMYNGFTYPNVCYVASDTNLEMLQRILAVEDRKISNGCECDYAD